MQIVVIGASNSIIGERGFVGALRRDHDVTNISAGDVPVFFTLSKILTRQQEIAQADYIILDHSISDRLGYCQSLRQNYIPDIQDIYRILMSINPNVISIVFPLNLTSDAHERYLVELENICQRLSVFFVNLQSIATNPVFFEDVAHVHCEVSYLIGLSLCQFISTLPPRGRMGSGMARHAYTVREAESLSTESRVCRFESSIAEADYVVVEDETVLEFEHQHQAVYIEYVVLREDPRWMAMDVNGAAHYYGGLDITGDVVSSAISNRFVFSPINDERELRLPYSRGPAISTRCSPMNLVRLIFRNNDLKIEDTPRPSFEVRDFDMSMLWNTLGQLDQTGWFEEVQDLSRQSAEIIHAHNRKGMVEHKKHFSETVENGNRVRRRRMELFWNIDFLG